MLLAISILVFISFGLGYLLAKSFIDSDEPINYIKLNDKCGGSTWVKRN